MLSGDFPPLTYSALPIRRLGLHTVVRPRSCHERRTAKSRPTTLRRAGTEGSPGRLVPPCPTDACGIRAECVGVSARRADAVELAVARSSRTNEARSGGQRKSIFLDHFRATRLSAGPSHSHSHSNQSSAVTGYGVANTYLERIPRNPVTFFEVSAGVSEPHLSGFSPHRTPARSSQHPSTRTRKRKSRSNEP